MCEIEIKIAYNENVCIKREKKITHVDIGEEDIHHHIYIYIYIAKISRMYVNMVTRPMYKKLKEAPKITRR